MIFAQAELVQVGHPPVHLGKEGQPGVLLLTTSLSSVLSSGQGNVGTNTVSHGYLYGFIIGLASLGLCYSFKRFSLF